MNIIFLLLILVWFLSWWLWLFKQARQIKNPQKRLICVSLCVFLCVSLCVIPIFLHYSPMRIRAMSSFLSVMSIFAIVCWVWGWIYLFRQAKQIKNESEYFKYGSLSIISLTLPLVLLFYLSEAGLREFIISLVFMPFWFRSPSDTKGVRRFISCFVFYLLMHIPFLFTCCAITYDPDYVRQILPLLTIFWCLAWFWLIVMAKSIANQNDRFKFAFWRVVVLFILPVLLLFVSALFVTYPMFGVIEFLILFVLLSLWCRLPSNLFPNDKGFKRRILLVIFLCFCYFTAFIATALNSSTSTSYYDTFEPIQQK